MMYAQYYHRIIPFSIWGKERGAKNCLIGLVLLLFMAMSAIAYAGGGIEWTNINNDLPNDIQISNMAVDPGSSSIIYAVASSGEVYKTVDSGSNWTNISNGLDISSKTSQNREQGGAYTALAVDSTNIYLGCNGRIFKGAKDGSSWTDITGTMTMNYWKTLSIVAQSGNIYVGNQSGVYKSMDGGASWARLTLPTVSYQSVVSGTTTGNLYALSYSGLLVTTDSGQNWGTVTSQSFNNLLVYPDAMYATTWNGIVKSINNGVTWGQ